MADLTDGQLLDEFVRRGSPAAFEQVVRRHMDWVYSCARRMMGDGHLAEDVAQAVFILLAGKARSLRRHSQLGGWLFRATRYCAANAIKQENRRRQREREAMQTQIARDAGVNWEEIYPVLDESVARLGGADRDAVLLRFYQGKTFAEVGREMGLSEEAAKKRVQRAVEKLRGMLVQSGGGVSAGSLADIMTNQVTQAAPVGLVGAAVAASAGVSTGTSAGVIAKAAGELLWWAKAKVAAMVVIGGVAVGVTSGIVVHAVGTQPSQIPDAAAILPPSAAAAPVASTTSSSALIVFDAAYEKAPGSGPGLSMKVGPNTFAVTAVVRYGADGKPLATDGRGKPVDLSTLPVANMQPLAKAGRDTLIICLEPGRERYDIDRLRLFNHATRRSISGFVASQIPGVSALQIESGPGMLPQQIDLWLDVASYDAANVAVSLPAKKGATVAIGGAVVSFDDIRDGAWSMAGGKFTTVSVERPQTTLVLRATGNWNVGRYQISAVSNSGQRYLSDFFINLSSGVGPPMFFPFGLDQLDHFELRPLAHLPPFYFDGVELPPVEALPAAPGRIPQPIVVAAGKLSRMRLPCGAVVELTAISYHPLSQEGWWGVDGLPAWVPGSRGAEGSSVSDDHGRLKVREFTARLVEAPAGISGLLWHFEPAMGWAGGGSGTESCVAAALDGDSPITVRVGVAATPWEVVEEIAVNKLPAQLECWPGVIEGFKATMDGVVLSTAMIDMPSNMRTSNMRMMLIDRSGNPHTPDSTMSSSEHEKIAPWGSQSVHMTYRGLRGEDVRSIRFEARREEYAAFENVSLQPK